MLFQIFKQKISDIEIYETAIQVLIFLLIILFILSFATTIGPICWIFLVEIMTEIGVGIAVSANWIIIICVSILPSFNIWWLPKDSNECDKDLSVFFFAFSGTWMVGFFLITLFVKETKDMSPYQIMMLYKEKEYNPLVEE